MYRPGMLYAALAAGTFALAFVVGDALMNGWRVRRTTRLGLVPRLLCVALGMALMTPVLVVLAEISLFLPAVIGAVGWVSLGGWIFARRRSQWRFDRRAADALLVAFVAAFALVAAIGRDEPWGAGRDQQVYATFALALADSHGAVSAFAPFDRADERLLHVIGDDLAVDRYLGIRRSERQGTFEFASYLPLGWTVWLAIAVAIGGLPGLYVANTAIFAAGGVLLYAVVRRYAGSVLAIAAAVALLALPSSLWIAGTALSEPLAMLCWLAMIALITSRGYRAMPALVPLVFAMSCIRIDALALAPLLCIAVLIHALAGGSDLQRGAVWRFSIAMLVAFVATLVWYAAFNAAYLRFNLEAIVAIGVAIGTVALASACPWVHARGQRALRSRVTFAALAALLAGSLAYAAILRPELPPFSLIHNGTGLDGSRDFREESVRDIAAYVGWPLVVLAVVGAVATFRRLTTQSAPLAFRIWVVGGLGVSVLYLALPLVSPDHPWAVRRMIPVVIPAVMMFAVFALHRVFQRTTGLRAVVPAVALAALACDAAAAYGTRVLALRENAGMGARLSTIAAALPDALVVCDVPLANVCGPLGLAWRRHVVVADMSSADARAAITQWIAAKAQSGKAAWMLHTPLLSTIGTHAQVVDRWQLARTFVVPTPHPPAREVASEWVDAQLSRIDGLDPAVAATRFGGTPTWGVADHGFYASTITPFGTVRMTDGSASLDLPAELLANAHALVFDWFSWAPRGEARPTRVRVADRDAWEGTLSPGVSTTVVAVPAEPRAGVVRVEILSETFDPRFLDASDRRTHVGIGLLGIRAVAYPPGVVYAVDPSVVRAQLDVERVPRELRAASSSAFALALANRGSAAWPASREPGIDAPIGIGVRWYPAGRRDRPIAQSRSPLPLAMYPGDRDTFEIPLTPRTPDGRAIDAGKYDVVVGIVSGDRWLAGARAGTAQLTVVVRP